MPGTVSTMKTVLEVTTRNLIGWYLHIYNTITPAVPVLLSRVLK
jgi:hypothetical protein